MGSPTMSYFQHKAHHDEMKHAMKEQHLHMKAGNALAHGKVFKAVKLEAKAASEGMKKDMAHNRAGGPFSHRHPHQHHGPHHHHHGSHHHHHGSHHHHHGPHHPSHHAAPLPAYPVSNGPAYPTGTIAPPTASAYPAQQP